MKKKNCFSFTSMNNAKSKLHTDTYLFCRITLPIYSCMQFEDRRRLAIFLSCWEKANITWRWLDNTFSYSPSSLSHKRESWRNENCSQRKAISLNELGSSSISLNWTKDRKREGERMRKIEIGTKTKTPPHPFIHPKFSAPSLPIFPFTLPRHQSSL